ncbi:MAG: hypothetical protein ACOX7R_01280 [Acetivibrionales bacterium]
MKTIFRLISSPFVAFSGRLGKNEGFGLNELLGICAAVILAAFIVIPGLMKFAGDVMEDLGQWWDNTVQTELFREP